MDAETQRNLDLAKEAFGRRRSDLAETFLRRVLAREPRHAWAVTALSAAMRSQRRYPEALEQAQLALRLYPVSGYAHITLAIVLAIVEEREPALRHGFEALRLLPEFPRHYRLVANILHELERYEEAIEMAKTGLSLRADYVPLQRQLAASLAGIGRRDESMAVLENVFRTEPNEPETFCAAAWAAWLLKEPATAVHHARHALSLKPTSADAHGLLGLALMELDQPAEAAVHLEECLKLNPYDKRVRAALEHVAGTIASGLPE